MQNAENGLGTVYAAAELKRHGSGADAVTRP